MQRGRIVEGVACCDIKTSPQQGIDAIKMAFGGRDMQQRPIPLAAGNRDFSRMLRQQPVEVVRAALLGRSDNLAVETKYIDARLQRAPTWKAVLIGNGELGLVELCRCIVAAQCRKLLF